MSSMAKKVTPKDLKQWISQSPEKIAIIDVRDDDHFGGHIAGSKNYPSSIFADRLPQIIEETKDKDKVVFHCSLSQQRGPRAGRMYEEARKLVGEHGHKPEIYILEGGFVNWHAHGFAQDARITQGYDAEHWRHGFQG